MTPLIDIYRSIANVLRVPGLGHKWIDIDMGQLESDGIHLPLVYPAILVKFDDVTWKDDVAVTQTGVVTLSIKVVFQFQIESEILAMPVGGRNEVIQNFLLLDLVHQAITGIAGTTFNRFRRFNQYQMNTNPKDLLWVQVLQYQCNIKSDASTPAAALAIDYNNIKDNNSFMERRRFNLIHK